MTTNRQVVVHYIKTMLAVGFNVFCAFCLAAATRGKVPIADSAKFQAVLIIFGTALLLSAAVGKLGWSIQTIKGETAPEKLNERIYLVLSHIGTFVLFSQLFLMLFDNSK